MNDGDKNVWTLADIGDDFISDLPLLIHSLNHGPVSVYPWPTLVCGDPYAEEKALLLLSLGFVPSTVKPAYADQAFENFEV